MCEECSDLSQALLQAQRDYDWALSQYKLHPDASNKEEVQLYGESVTLAATALAHHMQAHTTARKG